MLGFLKRRARREHLRLISENRRMAVECLRVFSSAMDISDDAEAAQMAEEMATVIADMDELASYMDRNELLPQETAADMLKMYKYLSSQVEGIEKGRRHARKFRGE